MDLIAIAGAGLVAAAAAVLLKQYKPEYAMMISLAAAGLLFFCTGAGGSRFWARIPCGAAAGRHCMGKMTDRLPAGLFRRTASKNKS